MRILTAAAMRALDRQVIEQVGLPGLVLMENAALGVVEALARHYPRAESAAIFCGPGNNGGDGLAVARQLATRGYAVEIFLASGGRPSDAALQLAVCRRLGLSVREASAVSPGGHGGLPEVAEVVEVAEVAQVTEGVAAAQRAPGGAAEMSAELIAEWLAAAARCDVVIDALFGTGLARPLAGGFARLVEGLDGVARPRIAVDIPSGLAGSSATPIGPHLHADLTVTFAAPKVAHILPPAADAVGELVVADLGYPPRLVEAMEDREESGGNLHLLVGEELAALLPPRARDSNKGDFGHLLLVAGALGKAGAAVLAARAAVRSGCGLVTAAVATPIVPILHAGCLEAMVISLAASPGGALAAAAAGPALAATAGRSALALGPGLGAEEGTVEAIRQLVAAASLPLVLDADGLNAFAGRAGELAARPAPTVLTPHPGELGRLLGCSTAAVQADRPAAARRAAALTGAIVVLKGSLTLVAVPGGGLYVNPTGNPGMASGGSGDVLTGILGGLLAQRLEVLDATLLAVYLHGLAGDLALARLGGPALAAEDLIVSLPAAFAELTRDGAP